MLAPLDEGLDIAIGTRHRDRILVRQPWYREWMGKVFTRLVQLLIANVSDVTCGFKAFRGEVGREILSRTRIYGWSFDAELLLLARKLGFSIQEVPVPWHDVEGTKVRLGRDVIGALIGLARIRLNSISGVYEERNIVDPRMDVWLSDAPPATSNPDTAHDSP